MKKINTGIKHMERLIIDNRGQYTDPNIREYMLGILNCALNESEGKELAVYRFLMRPYDVMKGAVGGPRGLHIRWSGNYYIVAIDISHPYGKYGMIPTLTYHDANSKVVETGFPTGAGLVNALKIELDRSNGQTKTADDDEDEFDDDEEEHYEDDNDDF